MGNRKSSIRGLEMGLNGWGRAIADYKTGAILECIALESFLKKRKPPEQEKVP
jgi:hypothetical protein